MIGWYLYLLVSIVASVLCTKLTYEQTDLDGYGIGSRVSFILYFAVANVITWPLFLLFCVIFGIESCKKETF